MSDKLPCLRHGDMPNAEIQLNTLRAELLAHKQAADVFAGGSDAYRYWILTRQILLLEEQLKRSR